MEIVSRSQARERGMTYYYTGMKCSRGHIAQRYTSNCVCVECSPIVTNAWSSRHPERYRAIKRNSDRRHSHKRVAKCAARRARQALATPQWLSADHLRSIAAVYEKCSAMTRSGTTRYHVDHIVPIRGRNVCGLHVPWNLQVIPALENIRKNNKHE